MVTQKLISFKVDVDQLENLDVICSLTGCNRNKFINKCLNLVIPCVKMQLDFADKFGFSYSCIPFLT